MSDKSGLKEHWDKAYTARTPKEVSWFQSRPDVSLELIAKTHAALDASIIDVGGGASTLVDHLLDAGRTTVTVLDLAEPALAHAMSRLGERAKDVNWIVADITKWLPPERGFDVWHDRAVLYFLTESDDQNAYATTLRSALRGGGRAIIGGFEKGGPTRCSGLDTVQHDATSLKQLLGAEFNLEDVRSETHRSPGDIEQLFTFHVFRRKA